jgi:hypothetical protein
VGMATTHLIPAARQGRLIYCGDHCVTYSFGGHAFLAKLLGHFSPAKTVIVEAGAEVTPLGERLPGYEYRRIRFPMDRLERTRWSQWHARWVAQNKTARGKAIRKALGLTPADCLVTIAHDFVWIPVVEAAHAAGAKCLVFCDDEWVDLYGHKFSSRESAAHLYANQLNRASKVFAVSEGMKRHLEEAYGVKSEVFYRVRGLKTEHKKVEKPARNIKKRMIYCGQLWEGYWKSLRELAKVCQRYGWEIEIFTNRQGQRVVGTEFPNVRAREFLPEGDLIPHLQANADALVVALAYELESQNLMKTMFASKLVEYTATDRPTILLAPPHSEMARWGKEAGCFLVLDSLEPTYLEEKLKDFMKDPEGQRQMGLRAKELGDRLFSPERAKDQIIRAWKN